jgi:hypothetical protein
MRESTKSPLPVSLFFRVFRSSSLGAAVIRDVPICSILPFVPPMTNEGRAGPSKKRGRPASDVSPARERLAGIDQTIAERSMAECLTRETPPSSSARRRGTETMRTLLFALAVAVLCLSGCHHHNLACNSCQDGCQDGCQTCGPLHSGMIDRGLPSRVGHVPHGYNAGPAGPPTASYAYPYYTTRAPRDFLQDNPPSIGR